jgi:DNA-binding NarL/FixJ family response regulator
VSLYRDAMPVRVVLAEDHQIIREGLRAVLDAAPETDLLAACGTYDEVLVAVDEHRPDVVLTDIRMPPGLSDEGIRVADRLRTSHPETGVVVLSQHDDPDFVMALLRDGSAGRGYLLKERTADPDQLVKALIEVAAGGSVIDPKVVEVLVRARLERESSPLEALTERERDVLAEMATGKDNAAIAAALVLTVRSVEKYINGIFSKLGLSEETDVHRRVKAVLVYLSAA